MVPGIAHLLHLALCFMQSCFKCNNISLNKLSHLAFYGSGSHMYKRFSCILSQFKPDAMTFCNMNTNYFYNLIQNHHQEELDEKLHNKVSFAKDVLYIENACSMNKYIIIHLLVTIRCIRFQFNSISVKGLTPGLK